MPGMSMPMPRAVSSIPPALSCLQALHEAYLEPGEAGVQLLRPGLQSSLSQEHVIELT